MLYFGPTDNFNYTKIYEIIAKRYDKAFFLRAELGSELEFVFNVTETPQVILFRHFEENLIHFNKNWTAKNMERWII